MFYIPSWLGVCTYSASISIIGSVVVYAGCTGLLFSQPHLSLLNNSHQSLFDPFIFHPISKSLVLSIGMGPMPAIVELWGYDGQNSSFSSSSSSSSSRSTPITQKGNNIKT